MWGGQGVPLVPREVWCHQHGNSMPVGEQCHWHGNGAIGMGMGHKGGVVPLAWEEGAKVGTVLSV